MQRDGEEGRKKITAITRYVTVGLALFESVAMAIGFGRQGLIPNMNFFKGLTVVACLTACLLYTSNYGEFGLVATEPCWIRSNQIESARVAMTRYIKRGGKVWIKIFPDKPVTAKPRCV